MNEGSLKKALCVGINNFKNYPSASLNGCINDAEEMKNVLIEYFGFSGSDITLLTDIEATKSGIMSQLEEMVSGAREGRYNHLVFSLSSHGTQVPDLNGDEPDNADECFCPFDLAQTINADGFAVWDKNNIITDDELRNLFKDLPEEVKLEVYLDTCHSGSGLKAIDFLLTRRPRFLTPPSLEALLQIDGCTSRGLGKGLMEKGVTKHILWSGCRADQTSADAMIGDDWHGAFTYYYCLELKNSNNGITRKELLKRVRKDLKDNNFTQIPQLEIDATNINAIVG